MRRAVRGMLIKNKIRFIERIQEPFRIKHVEVIPTEDQVNDDWERGGLIKR